MMHNMDLVRLEAVRPHVTLLTLDRPERLNALSWQLVGELHDALDVIGRDAECRVVVMTGAGRGFCAGLDLKDEGRPPRPGEHPHAHAGVGGQEFIASLPVHMRATPQVIVAAVNGPAYGGGLSLALGAEIRIASPSAEFCSAYIRTGLTGTDVGVSWLLPRLVGASAAFDMILTGRAVGSDEALQMRLVSRVVPAERLLDEAFAIAETIASYSRTGLLMTKEVMWANLEVPTLTAAISLENRNQKLASRTGEIQDYITAFRQRSERPR